MHLQVTTTVDSREAADRLAASLVSERLAACVQVQGPIASTYRWQGAVETATEWYCHAKTTAERFEALRARLAELHPYDVPEIVALPIVRGHPPYLAWLEAETRPEA